MVTCKQLARALLKSNPMLVLDGYGRMLYWQALRNCGCPWTIVSMHGIALKYV